MADVVLTIAEVAAETRHGRSAVERWIRTGIAVAGGRVRLGAMRIGGRYAVTRDSLDAFVRALNPGAPAPVETVTAATRRASQEQETARRLLAGGAP